MGLFSKKTTEDKSAKKARQQKLDEERKVQIERVREQASSYIDIEDVLSPTQREKELNRAVREWERAGAPYVLPKHDPKATLEALRSLQRERRNADNDSNLMKTARRPRLNDVRESMEREREKLEDLYDNSKQGKATIKQQKKDLKKQQKKGGLWAF